jgi:AcrR family transcriptional regulator
MESELLDAANALLAAHGPSGLTMSALAQRTGISRATLYRRAGSKAALLDALAAAGAGVGGAPSPARRLLDAMHQLVGVEGRLDVTVEQLAVHAGVSVMAVYRGFGSRAALVQAFVEEASPRARSRRILTEQPRFEDGLLALARSALEFASRYPGLALASLTARQDDGVLEEFRRSDRSTRKLLLRYFRQGRAAGELNDDAPTRMVAHWMGLVFAEGVLLPYLRNKPSAASIDKRARRVVAAFLKLYGAKSQPASKAELTRPSRR